ncbi:MAG: hypothetical protein GTO18_01755 [Anaerolineales bacterium]|nr:hypothetical protein [Anaerolineales bacterium]
MKTHAPIQLNSLAKTVVFIFFALNILWGVTNYIFLRGIYLHWSIPAINSMLALILGGLFYRNYRHTIFSYDQEGFQMQVGKNQVSAQWRDFSTVSLFHRGFGEFTIRLYQNSEDFFEIPASALKLDPREFRFEVIQLVKEP